MKPFIVSWSIYPFDVLVCLGTKPNDVIATLEKMIDLSDGERTALSFPGVGRTVMLEGGQTMLWVKNPRDLAVLSHEIFHAVTLLFNHIGIELSGSSEEAFAYAIEYLTRAIEKGKKGDR